MRGAMDGIFGASATGAVLYHLKERGITIEEGVERPKELIGALTDIFGAGAMAIEMAFVDGVGEAGGIDVKGMSLDRALSKSRSMIRSPHR